MSGYQTTDERSLFDINGQRKYLTHREAQAVLAAARRADRPTRIFCRLLYYTGARISEALQVTPRRLDPDTKRVIYRTLKRRHPTLYRAIPVPQHFMRELVAFAQGHGEDELLFPWCRQTAWRRVRALMDAAGIHGPQATPKGLRHQYGCLAIERGLSESLVGRLLGHAKDSKSTSVYTHVVGLEERALTARMWREPQA